MNKYRAFCAALLLALFASNAQAANLYISEYNALGVASGFIAQIANEPEVTTQKVDYSGGVAASAAFNANTAYVRVLCDTQCAVKFGAAGATPTATTASKLLPALTPEYFAVPATGKVSVISNP